MKITKLEDCIRESIYTYPTLYRGKDYETSRLKVLNHLFLVIGNGYEWEKAGFLGYGDNKGRKALPKNFFTKELYTFYVDSTKKMGALKRRLKKEKRFHYFLDKGHKNETEVVFEADKETAQDYVKNYEVKDNSSRDFVFVEKASSEDYVTPYPICEYSAVKEIYNGKTNSPHIENFELKKIQPDWLAGAIDIAKVSLAYYNDKERYKDHIYYADRKAKKPSDHRSLSHWAKYRKEQVDFLEKFLKKFDKG